MDAARTYIFAGGGTGGHLYPGIAVAQELQRREPDARVRFVGSDKVLEESILAPYHFEHHSLPVESLHTLKRRPVHFIVRNWQAWRSARLMIRDERPAVVVGMGGYASAPIVWAANRAGIPVVLLEQNVIPGRTTRWLARSAAVICVSFPETAALPTSVRIEVAGNPLRREIADLHADLPRANAVPLVLLVIGGSQGADSLNDAVMIAVQKLTSDLANWRIVHQAGPRQVESIRATYSKLSVTATVEPFFSEMADQYREASLVISRAGATSIAEMTCASLPMILLPYPHAADDHQRANAKSLANHGAAIVVEHRTSALETGQELAAQLQPLLNDSMRRKGLGTAAHAIARPHAAAAVADQIQRLCKQ